VHGRACTALRADRWAGVQALRASLRSLHSLRSGKGCWMGELLAGLVIMVGDLRAG
jgi:hypothetical protein